MKKKKQSSYSSTSSGGPFEEEWGGVPTDTAGTQSGSFPTYEEWLASGGGRTSRAQQKKKKKRTKTAVILAVVLAVLLLAGALTAFFVLRAKNAQTDAPQTETAVPAADLPADTAAPAEENTTGAVPEQKAEPTPNEAPDPASDAAPTPAAEPSAEAAAESVAEPSAETAADPDAEQTLTVHFIDVGQADCALLICGGQTMLIDGGNPGDAENVTAYLTDLGVTKLDYVVCTHPHKDHAGGLAKIAEAFPVGTALVSVEDRYIETEGEETEEEAAVNSSYGYFHRFLKAAAAGGADVKLVQPGDTFTLGGAVCTVVGPVVTVDDFNNMSLMLRVEFNGSSFLFTGDAVGHTGENDEAVSDEGFETESDDEEEEKTVTAYWSETDPSVLDVDVLKVAHHGSAYSTCSEFLYYTSPEYAVISVGADNGYGHPSEDTIDRLQRGIYCNAVVYRTDEQGTVVCTVDADGLHFTTLGKSAE